MSKYRVKNKGGLKYDSGMDADDEDESEDKLLSELNRKAVSLAKREVVDNEHNNNNPTIKVSDVKSKSQHTSTHFQPQLYHDSVTEEPKTVALQLQASNDIKVSDIKSKSRHTSTHFQPHLYHDSVTEEPKTALQLPASNDLNDGTSVKSRLISLIQDLTIKEEEKVYRVQDTEFLSVPVMHEQREEERHKETEVGDPNNNFKKSVQKKSRKASKKSRGKSSSKSDPPSLIEQLSVSPPIHKSNITTNMSLTQYPHTWGQLKLLQEHLPPWKQVDTSYEVENEDEEFKAKPKKSIVYPAYLERSKPILGQNYQQKPTFNSSYTVLQAYQDLSMVPVAMQRSFPDPPAPVVQKQFLVPLPPYPIEYSKLRGSTKSKKKFRNVKRAYPRPWVLPMVDYQSSTSKARKKYEDENERARRIIKAMWQKEEEEEREALKPKKCDSNHNPAVVLQKINSEMAMIDRLLTEIHGDKVPSIRVKKRDIFYNYSKERQELEMARDKNRKIATKPKRCLKVTDASADNNGCQESQGTLGKDGGGSHLSRAAYFQQLSTPVFDSDLDLPDILKPNFQYLYQADDGKFQERNSNSKLVYRIETESVDPNGTDRCPHPPGNIDDFNLGSNGNRFVNNEFRLHDNVDPLRINSYEIFERYGGQDQWDQPEPQNSQLTNQYLEHAEQERGTSSFNPPPALDDGIDRFFETKDSSRPLEKQTVVTSNSNMVPVGRSSTDRFDSNRYPESNALTNESEYTPPPHIEPNMVERFLTSTNQSRKSERFEMHPGVLHESHAKTIELRMIDTIFTSKDDSTIESGPDSGGDDEIDEESSIRDSSESIQSSESLPSSVSESLASEGSWTHLPTPSDQLLLKNHKVTEEWINKMVEINGSHSVADVYPIIQTLFASSGGQRQSRGVQENMQVEQIVEEESEIEVALEVGPPHVEETRQTAVFAHIDSSEPITERSAIPRRNPINPISNASHRPGNVSSVFKTIGKSPSKIPVVRHVRAWNAPAKPPPRKQPNIPPKPKPLAHKNPNWPKSGTEPTKKPQVKVAPPRPQNSQSPRNSNKLKKIRNPSPPHRSKIPRSLHLESILETYYEPQKQYRIQEFVSKAARIKTLSHVLRGRVMSAPADLHLDFSSSLIDLRVPTAKDFNQVLRGCKSFMF